MPAKSVWKALVLNLLLAPALSYASGGIPQHVTAFIGNPGQSDTLCSYSYYSTDHFWNRHGRKLPAFNKFKRHTIFLYSEYALNACNSLSVQAGFNAVRETLNGNSQNFQDAVIGWKHLFAGGETYACTGEIKGIIPTGKRKSCVRYGRSGIECSLLYSSLFSVSDQPGWYNLKLGYRLYRQGPSDQTLAAATMGVWLTDCIAFIGSGFLDYGVSNGNRSFNSNNIVNSPNYRLLTGQLECLIQLGTHAYLTFGAFSHLWGREVGTGGGYFGGFWMVF